MKIISISKYFAFLVLGILLSSHIKADVPPTSLPTDAHLAVLKFNPSQIYTILTAPAFMTHLELEVGEKLIMPPAMGDTIQWDVDSSDNHLFVKPNAPSLRTNMSIVTNKRSYQFILISSPEGGFYYQYIKFKYPTSLKNYQSEPQSEAVKEVTPQPSITVLDPTQLNSNYKISGSAKFKPEFVQDDGKFTYIKFPQNLEDIPIIYVKENGAYSVVNYTSKQKNQYVTVTRTADEFVLVLDNEKVTISKKKSGFFQ